MELLKKKILFIIIISLSGCVVPLQTAKVVIAESYVQSFKPSKDSAENILHELLGTKEVSILRENGTRHTQYDLFKAGKCEARGSFIITLSVIPESIKDNLKDISFFISGFGRYAIYIKDNNGVENVYYTADFRIVEEEIKLNSIKEKEIITVKFKQQITNHFSYDTGLVDNGIGFKDKYNEEIIEVDIKIKKLYSGEKVFMIDYSKEHEVKVDDIFIGYLYFGEKSKQPRNVRIDNSKIIDLRGLRYLRKYKF